MSSFSSAEPECHFITLAEILSDYEGSLSRYIEKTAARNIIITMQVDMSVAGAKAKHYGAALAISHDYEDAEELLNLARQSMPKKMPLAFGWVPANLYGTDEFGIFIEQGTLGDMLANGLIDDMIQSAKVEEAVAT